MQPAVRPRTILLPRRALLFFLTFVLAAFLAVPALAEYLGPNRTTVELVTVRDPDHDVWTLTNDDPPSGVLPVCLIIHTCDQHPGVISYGPICLWGTNPAEHSSCSEAFKEELQEITYPEATISAELLNCNLVDGWCTSSPALHLTGLEPIIGKSITLVEGTRNGELFACAGDFCDVPLLQGDNIFTFWAISNWGDSSQMGTFSAKVDSLGPSIQIPDVWNIWEPLAIQADDAGVGVETIKLTIHSDQYGDRKFQWAASVLPGDFIWDRYFGDLVAPIGDYSVTVRAWDTLGNDASASGLILIPAPESLSAPEDPELSAALIVPSGVPTTESAQASGPIIPAITSTDSAERAAEVRIAKQDQPILQSVSVEASSSKSGAAQPLWGAAALALSYAATSYALSRRKAREESIEQLRREVAKSTAERSFEKRLARIWSGVQPVIASLLRRQRTAERSAQGQATATRWQALGEYYEKKERHDSALSASSAESEDAAATIQQGLAIYYASERSSGPAVVSSEPAVVMEPVPSFWSDPLGWAQARIINAGRSDEGIGGLLTSALSPLVDTLKSIAEPERNPRTAAFHESVGSAAEVGLEDTRNYLDTAGETIEAIQEARWSDAAAGAGVLGGMHVEGAASGLEAWGRAVWNLVTTPVRLVFHDVPEFASAVNERLRGEDRTWDVLFTAAMLDADLIGTYGIAKVSGVADSVNTIADRGVVGSSFPEEGYVTSYEHGSLIPDEDIVNFQGWEARYTEYAPGTRIYRMHSPIAEGGSPYRPWWLSEPPTSELQFRLDAAHLPAWGSAQEMSIILVPEGEVLPGWTGAAAYQGGFYLGGGEQVYLPVVPHGWITTVPAPWLTR